MNRNRIVINSVDRIDMISYAEIMYIQSSGKYTTFVTSNKRRVTSSSNIGSHYLPDHLFIRVHNSYVVNINFILYIQKGENWNIILMDSTSIPVSRRKRDELTAFIMNS